MNALAAVAAVASWLDGADPGAGLVIVAREGANGGLAFEVRPTAAAPLADGPREAETLGARRWRLVVVEGGLYRAPGGDWPSGLGKFAKTLGISRQALTKSLDREFRRRETERRARIAAAARVRELDALGLPPGCSAAAAS